ncbi:MAG: bifunctional hydroxymethylpyrimidine kinase/phosphomethylpyrimidine kinase [Clostridia bacterium]
MRNNRAPRVAVAQDLSGIGRSALAVALPTLAALGVQACPLPTALLSAHTAFPGVQMIDQTDFLGQALEEWTRLDRSFEGVYTGFLATPKEAVRLRAFICAQRARGCGWAVVDPAMADHGSLYRTVPAAMPDAMRDLVAVSDLTTPNYTEACLLTGTPYQAEPLTPQALRALLRALIGLGCKAALVTGARLQGGACANALLRAQGDVYLCRYAPLPAAFPGTGDLLCAMLTGRLLTGMAPEEALGCASGFAYEAIRRTLALGTDPIEGVQFEGMLCALSEVPRLAVEKMSQ